MKSLRWSLCALLVLMGVPLLGGCSDDSSSGPEAPAEDVAEAPDVTVEEDTTPDEPEDVEEEPEDIQEEPEEPEDIQEEPEEPPPPPEPIAFPCESEDQCTFREACIDGWCRMPVENTSWASTNFTLVEPERVRHVFETLKTFGTEVAFVGIEFHQRIQVFPEDPEEEPYLSNAIRAQYGSVDILERFEGLPIQAAWQFPRPWWSMPDEFPPGRGTMVFHPYDPDTVYDTPNTYESDPFTYDLAAIVSAFGNRVGITLRIEEARYRLTRLMDREQEATVRVTGVLSREEAEDSPIEEHAIIGPLRPNLCRGGNVSYDPRQLNPPRTLWTLADILDCNLVEMDVSLEDDGPPNAYAIEVLAPMARTPINEP